MSPIKLETGLRPNSAGIPYALLVMSRIEAMGFPTFGLLPFLTDTAVYKDDVHCRALVNGTLPDDEESERN